MKDISLRKLTEEEAAMLEKVMGFANNVLKPYEGRWVKIILKSPKKFRGCSGEVYINE